ncbi:hypothetical protein Zmor_014715 [Zophobas morio]|uniref:Uncharacterized protein n=1 Tax=Zophobas morio TaxID=2755281 RepID=A0AA38IF67_9CUCU|nr:hypothetical protein Zmor_014715 [Zophobas morio]
MASMGILLYEFVREGDRRHNCQFGWPEVMRVARFAMSSTLSFPSLPLYPLIQQRPTLFLCVTSLSVYLHSQTSPDQTMQLSLRLIVPTCCQ